MTTMELIALATNLTSVTEKIDYFSEELDIDFDTSDIEEAIDECRRAKDIGSSVWLMFMDKVQDKWREDYPNFDPDKFDWYLNGCDTHIYYDGTEIHSQKDIDSIFDTSEENEDEQQDRIGSIPYPDRNAPIIPSNY